MELLPPEVASVDRASAIALLGAAVAGKHVPSPVYKRINEERARDLEYNRWAEMRCYVG